MISFVATLIVLFLGALLKLGCLFWFYGYLCDLVNKDDCGFWMRGLVLVCFVVCFDLGFVMWWCVLCGFDHSL